MQMNKKQGGLGLRDIRLMNGCLLLKWWWRYAFEDEALWKSVICAKYGVSGDHWFPPMHALVSISAIWTQVLVVSYSNPRLHNFFLENVELRIGDGNKVKFWQDIWLETSSLKSQFPRLYQLSLNKENTLKMQIGCRDNSNSWCFNFRRPLFGWEEDEVLRLQNLLGVGPCLVACQKDSIRWKADQSGIFTVGSMHNWCKQSDGPILSYPDLVWNNFALPKAKFITWLTWKDRLKTFALLSRIGVLRGYRTWQCLLCKVEEETCNHILLFCPFAWLVWSNIMAWWGIQWVLPGSFEGLMQWWLGWKLRKKEKRVWRVIFISVIWSLWMYRNDCLFNNTQPDYVVLCELIKI